MKTSYNKKLIPYMTQASMAYEAYIEGQFGVAASLLAQYIQQVPQDFQAHKIYGDYLTCCGDMTRALESYFNFARLGGDKNQVGEHIIRCLASLIEDISNPITISVDAIMEQCSRLGITQEFDFIHTIAQDVISKWNAIREGYSRRREIYGQRFNKQQFKRDVLFFILPLVLFQPGYPPYGVGVLAEYLRQRGYSSEMVDINLELWDALDPPHKSLWSQGHFASWRDPFQYLTGIGLALKPDFDEIARLSAEFDASIWGFSCFHINRQCVRSFIPRLKALRPDAVVILGGADCFYPNQCVLRYEPIIKQVDAFVVGEGEIALLSINEAIKEGTALDDIAGVLTPKNSKAGLFKPSIPTPAEELVGFPRYDPDYICRIPKPHTRVIATNRGCVNRCDFCYDRKAWHPFRLRPPDEIVREIKYNIENHGVTRYHLADCATNASVNYLNTLCDLFIQNQIQGIHVSTSVMISDKMTQDLYRKMYEAGFRVLYFGLESGSTKVMHAMGKQANAKSAEQNLRESHQAGLTNVIFIIVGHPAEGEEDLNETLDFIKHNKKHIDRIDMINTCFICQETPLCDKMKQKGIYLPDNWYQLGSWIDGDNHLFERQRRKEILINKARLWGLSLGEEVTPLPNSEAPRQGWKNKLLARLRKRTFWCLQ